jgi:hypothetical protein
MPVLFATALTIFMTAITQQNVMAQSTSLTSNSNNTTSSSKDGNNTIASIGTETKEKEEKTKKNIQTVMRLKDAINTGDISGVDEFISPQYFNHESQIDPIRS